MEETILVAIPVYEVNVSGLTVNILLFTENNIVFVKRISRVADFMQALCKLDLLAETLAFLDLWRRGREVKGRIDLLKGTKIDVNEFLKLSKGSFLIPYSEIIYIKVKKPLTNKEVKIKVKSLKKEIEFSVGPAALYEGYSKDEIYNEILNNIKPIPKLKHLVGN